MGTGIREAKRLQILSDMSTEADGLDFMLNPLKVFGL
jgi:hypothetical protein